MIRRAWAGIKEEKQRNTVIVFHPEGIWAEIIKINLGKHADIWVFLLIGVKQIFIQSKQNHANSHSFSFSLWKIFWKKMGSPTYNHTAHAIHRKSHPLLLPTKLQSPVSPIPFVYRVENTTIAEWLTWKLHDYQGNTQFRQVFLDYTLQLRCRVPQPTCKCPCQGNTAPLYRKYWLKTQGLSKSVMDLAGFDISILLNG